MNKKFKRAVGSGLTFVMLVSSTVTMNTSTIFAGSDDGVWNFRNGATAEAAINGSSGEIDGLIIDATASGAKFDATRSDWAQCNTGTIISIPVDGPSEITIVTYEDSTTYTLDDVSYTGSQTVTYKGEAGYVKFVMGSDDYIGSIKVVAVELAEDDEDPYEYGFYDFGGAEGSLLSTADYTDVYGVGSDNKIPAANSGKKVGNLALISTDGSGRVYWDKSVTIGDTEYTGYYHTNGAQEEGKIKRTIEVDVKNAGDIISVVSSSADLKSTYSLEIYNINNKTDKYLNKAMPGAGSEVYFAAPSAGTYVINGFGQKANYYRVTVTKAEDITVTPAIYADGKALANTEVTINDEKYTTDADGKVSIETKTGTAFDVSATVDGSAFEGSFSIDPDGTYPDTVTIKIPRTTVTGTVTGLEDADKSLAKLVLKSDTETLYVDVKDGQFTESLDNDSNYTVSSVIGGYNPYTVKTSQINVSACDVTVENCKQDAKSKVYEYDLAKSVFPQDKTLKYTVATTSDGIVTFERTDGTFNWNDTAHGVALKDTMTVTIPVAGACRIVFGDCQYTADDSTITATAANSDYTETKTTTKSCSDTMAFDYTGDADTLVFTIGTTNTMYVPTLKIIPTIEIDSDVYVGYTDGSTPNFTSVADAINTITALKAPTSESERITVHVADGTYKERVVVTVPYITIAGASQDNTIITYNDSEANNDTYFHGATVAVLADGFKASNITFQNTAEDDKVANGKNATAFSIGYLDNLVATAELDNVNLLAVRDTVYTGKSTAQCELTLNKCLITGFQDVICGTGIVTLNSCTMDANIASGDTRFFAPASSNYKTVYTANDLTIKNSQGNGSTLYFARFWSQGSNKDAENYQVVINGYTVESGNLSTALFDKGLDSSDKNTKFFLYRQDKSDNYKTTYKDINEVALDTVDTDNSGVDSDGDYMLVGKTTTTLNTVADAIGFALYGTDGKLLVNLDNDTVYNVGDDDAQYTINFIKSKTGADSVDVKGFVSFAGYDIVNDASDATISLK